MKTIYLAATVPDDFDETKGTINFIKDNYDINNRIITLPSEEEIENGVTEIAKKNAKTSVGDYAVGYIAGGKAVLNKIKEQ